MAHNLVALAFRPVLLACGIGNCQENYNSFRFCECMPIEKGSGDWWLIQGSRKIMKDSLTQAASLCRESRARP
jgi:hypothetical protein